MKTILRLFILLSLITFSCKKKEDTIDEISNFTWTYQNQAYTATSSAAYLSSFDLSLGPNHILAYLGVPGFGTSYKVSIRLSALNPTVYPVSFTSNIFEYIDDFGRNLGAVDGTVTILSNTGNKLKGSFDVKILRGIGDTAVLKGQFNNVDMKP
jgi:hypothetical protein